MRRFHLAVLLAVMFLPSFLPGLSHAGGFSNADFGVRRMGMFATIARPDDGTAIFHNPAGLTLMEGTNFYHSQSWFFSTLRFRMYDSEGVLRPDHELKPDWSIGAIPFIGISSDFGLEKLRAGLAVYAPNAYGASLSDKEPTRYHATQVLFLASRATASVAWKFNEQFSLGANVNLIHVFLTATRYLNPFVLSNPDLRFTDDPEIIQQDHKLEIGGQDLTWSTDFGVLFRPVPTFRVGASFGGGSDVLLEGDVKLTDPSGVVTKATQKTRMVIPFSLSAGINWEFAPDFEFGADIRFWHYQVLQEQRSILSQPLLGMTEFNDPKNYGNSWNWCVGLLYHLSPKLELMMGYQEDYTPIPDQSYSLDNPSRDQKGVSIGARWQITPRVRVGLAFVENWFQLVDVQESLSTPPTNAKGYGANSEVGLDVTWRL